MRWAMPCVSATLDVGATLRRERDLADLSALRVPVLENVHHAHAARAVPVLIEVLEAAVEPAGGDRAAPDRSRERLRDVGNDGQVGVGVEARPPSKPR